VNGLDAPRRAASCAPRRSGDGGGAQSATATGQASKVFCSAFKLASDKWTIFGQFLEPTRHASWLTQTNPRKRPFALLCHRLRRSRPVRPTSRATPCESICQLIRHRQFHRHQPGPLTLPRQSSRPNFSHRHFPLPLPRQNRPLRLIQWRVPPPPVHPVRRKRPRGSRSCLIRAPRHHQRFR
jgi:hypothetical protein